MENGSEMNPVNNWKTTPLELAMLKGHLRCAELILEKGKKIF